MSEQIATFSDGSSLVYDAGRFDNNCVYAVQSDGSRRALWDSDYFQSLLDIGLKHGEYRVYDFFVCKIYHPTTEMLDVAIIMQLIEEANNYPEADRLQISKTYVSLYATLVAEERRSLPLGKVIKARAVHGLFYEGLSLEEVCGRDNNTWRVEHGLRKQSWREIAVKAAQYGFVVNPERLERLGYCA